MTRHPDLHYHKLEQHLHHTIDPSAARHVDGMLVIDLSVDVDGVESWVEIALHYSVTPDVPMMETVRHVGGEVSALHLRRCTPLQHAVSGARNFVDGHWLIPVRNTLLLLHLMFSCNLAGIAFINRFRASSAAASHFLDGHSLSPATTTFPYSSDFRFRAT